MHTNLVCFQFAFPPVDTYNLKQKFNAYLKLCSKVWQKLEYRSFFKLSAGKSQSKLKNANIPPGLDTLWTLKQMTKFKSICPWKWTILTIALSITSIFSSSKFIQLYNITVSLPDQIWIFMSKNFQLSLRPFMSNFWGPSQFFKGRADFLSFFFFLFLLIRAKIVLLLHQNQLATKC